MQTSRTTAAQRKPPNHPLLAPAQHVSPRRHSVSQNPLLSQLPKSHDNQQSFPLTKIRGRLLRRLRSPQIHHLIPHPDHPSQHDPPRPRAPRPPPPLPNPRRRLRLRPLRRDPLLPRPRGQRPPRLGRHGRLPEHARRRPPARRRGRPPPRRHGPGRALPRGHLRRRRQHLRRPVALQRRDQRHQHRQGAAPYASSTPRTTSRGA